MRMINERWKMRYEKIEKTNYMWQECFRNHANSINFDGSP